MSIIYLHSIYKVKNQGKKIMTKHELIDVLCFAVFMLALPLMLLASFIGGWWLIAMLLTMAAAMVTFWINTAIQLS